MIRCVFPSISLALAVILAGPAAAQTMGSASPEVLGKFLSSFMEQCNKGGGNEAGTSKVWTKYCACSAAVIADKFSMDEISDNKIMGDVKGMEAAHPGTTNFLHACMMGAKNDQ